MLVEIGGVDDEERLVAGVGVAVVLADGVSGRRFGDAAGPFGDGAVRVAGPFASERSEVCGETRDLVGRNLGRGGRREDAPEDEGGAESQRVCFRDVHGVHDLDPQNEYLMEAEMKSRSLSSLRRPA